MLWRIGSWVRGHAATSVAVVATVVVLAGLSAWFTTTSGTADRISATWKPSCTDGAVTTKNGEFVLHALPDWSCTLTVTIHNASDRSVHVSGIQAPLLGTQGGAEIVGRSTTDVKIRDDGPAAGSYGEIDAIYDVDAVVGPHSSYDVDLAVGWRSSGCTGATTSVRNWPIIRFDTYHRTFHRGAEQDLVLAPGPEDEHAASCRRG